MGILFQSSWDTATGYSDAAIDDGGKWIHGYYNPPLFYPYVSAGGPGGHNFLNVVSPGDGGRDSPYNFNWVLAGGDNGDIFGNPNDLYVRVYFRVHQSYADSGDDNMHWFMIMKDRDNTEIQHPLNFEAPPGDFPELDTLWSIGIETYTDGKFLAIMEMEQERWYCYEIHFHKIGGGKEQWFIRLDNVDITDKFFCGSGPEYGEYLDDLYDEGWGFTTAYHGCFWMAIYEQETNNDGWDISCVEVRDDRWPGLLDVDVTAPYVESQSPENEATDVSVNAPISCHVKDDGDGVDINSIVMQVNDVEVEPVITGTSADYTVTYTPESPLLNDTVYTITVDADDLA